MRPWPKGTLKKLRDWTSENGIHLILDEVMTGFGRTGTMFACQQENVIPDFLCLAKGLTGGSVPLAATLTTGQIYSSFLGPSENAFYYGHSYTANPIGCAAALASLELFRRDRVFENLPEKILLLEQELRDLRARHPSIREFRQCGLIAGIEFDKESGFKIATAARNHGLLTRNILGTVVFMPPLSVSHEEITFGIKALSKAISDVVQ
jgi:adenosylmethionine-8-amino-7-oxononanoate aminotransferase